MTAIQPGSTVSALSLGNDTPDSELATPELATPELATPEFATTDIEVSEPGLLLSLTGPSAARLSRLERALGLAAGLRGQVIRLKGPRDAVALGERVLTEMQEVAANGGTIHDADIGTAVRLLEDHPELKLRDVFQDVVITAASGKPIAPRGLAQKYYVQAIRKHDVVFGVGPAGTGKTYLAMAMAIEALQSQRVKRVVLTRPAVEAGEKLGFLPGDMAEKVDPYLRPLYDAMHDMLPAARANALIQRGVIEVAPLAFMRGRTLEDSFVILDEAQNTVVSQMKMFLTRVGPRSKAVITGDVTQVDLPPGQPSGLSDAIEVLRHVRGLSTCYFGAGDVVRHPLVAQIVRAYDARDGARAREQADEP